MKNAIITRRNAIRLLGGAGLSTALPLSPTWADHSGASLNFLAIGDWGRAGQYHQREVASRMGDSATALNARFVISVGDNFYEDGVTGIGDPAWESSFESVYDAPSLQVPWHIALGNHDYHGNTQAQIDYSHQSHRWRLPARWYSFQKLSPDSTLIDFFVTDTSPMIGEYYADGATKVKVADQRNDVPLQLAWLDSSLARSRAAWKIVVGHHPIYSGRMATGLSDASDDRVERITGGSPDLIRLLDPILQRHRVALYLNGHDHDLQHVRHGQTDYVCTGAGSRTADHCDMAGSDFCSLHPGFVACAANRHKLRVVYRDFAGSELHVVDILRTV